MGVVGRPNDILRKGRKLPPYIENGLKDLGPSGEIAREIVISHYEEFKDLSIEEIIEKLKKKYKVKI
jgi:hypothetical protein